MFVFKYPKTERKMEFHSQHKKSRHKWRDFILVICDEARKAKSQELIWYEL